MGCRDVNFLRDCARLHQIHMHNVFERFAKYVRPQKSGLNLINSIRKTRTYQHMQETCLRLIESSTKTHDATNDNALQQISVFQHFHLIATLIIQT